MRQAPEISSAATAALMACCAGLPPPRASMACFRNTGAAKPAQLSRQHLGLLRVTAPTCQNLQGLVMYQEASRASQGINGLLQEHGGGQAYALGLGNLGFGADTPSQL